MTSPGLVVPLAGFDVEAVIADTGERALVIAREVATDGERRLITRLPWDGDRGDRRLREALPPWDLPLSEVREERPGSVLLVEDLPVGVPSTALEASARLLPFAADVARLVAAAHATGQRAGRLHPALVFVADDGRLVAIGQRALRVQPARRDGLAPLFRASFATPSHVRGLPPTPADDVFSLASLAWSWRHGVAPFGSSPDDTWALLGGVPTQGSGPAPAGADELDGLLLRAFSPDPTARPSAAELLAAFEGA